MAKTKPMRVTIDGESHDVVAQPPYRPLLDLATGWDGVRAFSRARADLRREVEELRRLREVRVALGIDPPPAVSP